MPAKAGTQLLARLMVVKLGPCLRRGDGERGVNSENFVPLFLTSAQQVFNRGGFGIRQRGQAQGWLAGLWCGFDLRGLYLRWGSWVGPFIQQARRISGFAFQRGRQILPCHTSLRTTLTKAFEISNSFGSGRNGGEGGRLRRGIAARHLQAGRRRWQGKQDASYNQRFTYQSHLVQIPFRFFLRRSVIPRPSCWPIKPLKRIRFKFAENSTGLISQLLTLAGQLRVNSKGQVVARVKDVLDDGWKIRPLSMLLLVCAGTLGSMIVYNTLAKQPVGGRLAVASAPLVAGAAPQPVTTVVLKYDPLIQDAQRELLALGVYKGTVDGVNGLRTKQAIQDYQRLNGLAPTGEVSDDLINHMRFTHKVQAASQFTGSVAPAALQTAKPIQEISIKKVQVALAGLGYDINKLDGLLNDETHSAILKYQMDNGLDMSGEADTGLMQALKISGK